VSERIRSDPFESVPSREPSPEASASPERDPQLRHGPERLGAAAPQRISLERREELGQAIGRSAVAAQQREQDLAPTIGRIALAAERREETQQAVARQLGRNAVERARTRD
jgi:hypothetical protein